jgi:hypothetical protein
VHGSAIEIEAQQRYLTALHISIMPDTRTLVGLELDNSQIRKAFLLQARIKHPDKGGTAAEFRLLQEASQELTKIICGHTIPEEFDLFYAEFDEIMTRVERELAQMPALIAELNIQVEQVMATVAETTMLTAAARADIAAAKTEAATSSSAAVTAKEEAAASKREATEASTRADRADESAAAAKEEAAASAREAAAARAAAAAAIAATERLRTEFMEMLRTQQSGPSAVPESHDEPKKSLTHRLFH